MSFSLKQNYRFHDVNNNKKSSGGLGNNKNSNKSSFFSPSSLQRLTVISARRGGIIVVSDLLTSRDADLSTQVFLPGAFAALCVETPFYVTDVQYHMNRIHATNNPLMNTMMKSTSATTTSSVGTIVPISWNSVMSNMKGLEFTCFSSHALVVAFYWGNYIGRYYNLKSFIEKELKPKKPSKELLSEDPAVRRRAEQKARVKDFAFDVLAAELSRFWATMLRSPLELMRTNLIRDFYYLENNSSAVKQQTGEAAATTTTKEGAAKIIENQNPLGRKYNGMGDCAGKVLKEQGLRALIRRSQFHFLRFSGLLTSVALVSYDRARHGTGKQSEKKISLGTILFPQ